ncbi:MAG: ABC transporter ATP-binding protein [Chitinophagaceae bacterium]|nr:MAG: ABC transporter ATP-binding protein [Chitinophagaceae bacterium]
MRISLQDAGKRFNREWIFRHFSYEFQPSGTYAITGPNGSGKSTLLQVIAGSTLHSEGKILYRSSEKDVVVEDAYIHLSIAAPYLELIEEMTATEFLKMHFKFKNPLESIESILQQIGLEKAAHKQIRYFSSGMKQRLKLGQAFFSETPVLLLDEPTTNLDAEGIELYKNLVSNYTKNRLLLVSSNEPEEYKFCEEVIRIGDYK